MKNLKIREDSLKNELSRLRQDFETAKVIQKTNFSIIFFFLSVKNAIFYQKKLNFIVI